MSRPPAVELAGYLGAAVGVGEAARLYVTALRSAGVLVSERDIPLPGRDSAGAELPVCPHPDPEDISCNLLCLNPEQMVPFMAAAGAPPRAGRATVGIWSWEVDVLPAGWGEAARDLEEIWTYSRFAAGLIGSGIGTRVVDMPLPISTRAVTASLAVDLPSGFRVLMMFDFLSTLERKNPLGAIEAFLGAFGPEDGAILVIKSVNARHRPDRARELEEAVADRPDIVLIDRTMSSCERDALVAACDCYLSLHRSEGHGLPLAEAMAAGKPVIATGYGGNTEFMSEQNSYPVAWTATHVGEGVEHYPASARWAEPDIEHATRLLRAIHADRGEACLRGQRARADVMRLLAPEVVGSKMRDHLERLHGPMRQRPTVAASWRVNWSRRAHWNS